MQGEKEQRRQQNNDSDRCRLGKKELQLQRARRAELQSSISRTLIK
jgi:hypothetical protein